MHLSIGHTPLVLRFFMWIVYLTKSHKIYPWMRRFFIILWVKYNIPSSYSLLYRVVQLFKGVSLHKLKDLGFFSTRTSPESRDENEVAESVWDSDIWYPFSRIPDVRSFRVQLAGYDWIFAMFGIRKRNPANFEFDKYQNKPMNKYMNVQLKRLHEALNGKIVVESDFNSEAEFIESTIERAHYIRLGKSSHRVRTISRFTKPNPVLYFRICESLIKHSTTFFVYQLSKTEPLWHRMVPLWKVKLWYSEYRNIGFNKFKRLDYHRVFIPKANGKQRPLGVPSVPWRINLGLWNRFLLKYLRNRISVYQHAYQPGRGTMSAWRQISEFEGYRNIYSLDLQKYFDKVSLSKCIEKLENYGVPREYSKWFHWIHLSFPMNLLNSEYEPIASKDSPTWEFYANIGSSIKQQVKFREKLIKERLNGTTWNFLQIFSLSTLLEHNYWSENLLKDNYSTTDEIAEQYTMDKEGICADGRDRKWWNQASFGNKTRYLFPTPAHSIGVPQGAPISPLLAILALEDTVVKINTTSDSKVVGYADDWLYFTNNDEDEGNFNFEESGILLSEGKSFWVKRHGKWLRSLDFLGLSYNGNSRGLRANTRSGSKLVLDKEEILDYVNFEELAADPLCNYDERVIKSGSHCGVCSIEKGDLIDCPSPTMCVMGLGKRRHDQLTASVLGGRTWKHVVTDRIFGIIQSRLYNGSWNLFDVKQDFRLKYISKSWVDQKGLPYFVSEDMNVFTSTSFAIGSLNDIIRKQDRRKREIRRELQKAKTSRARRSSL